jgi:hypothetical protein
MLTFERRNKNDLSFPEDEIKLAQKLMDKLRSTIEFLYYLMDRKEELSFTMILFSSDDLQLENLIEKWKRQTDILYEIDKENNIYALLCQSTDSEGGEEFGEILMSNVRIHGGKSSYCVETEIKTTAYTIQEVIFTMVEKYIDIKQEKAFNKVFFTRLGDIEYL